MPDIITKKSNKYSYCTVERLRGFLTDKILRRKIAKKMPIWGKKFPFAYISQVAVCVTRTKEQKQKINKKTKTGQTLISLRIIQEREYPA